jgi:hypothetical protein
VITGWGQPNGNAEVSAWSSVALVTNLADFFYQVCFCLPVLGIVRGIKGVVELDKLSGSLGCLFSPKGQSTHRLGGKRR